VNDWKTLAASRGLQLSDAELAKLGPILEGIEAAYQSLAAPLTPLDQPAVTLGDEAVEAR
jgi:hypothetical protein